MMFGMHFYNVSVFLNSVVAAYVHLATQYVKLHADMWILQSLEFIRDLSKV